MVVVETDDFCGLTLHVLAHVPLAEAANLYDPRYVQWAGESTTAVERGWLEESVKVLVQHWRAGSPPMVHAWPQLWGSLDELSSVTVPEVASISPEQVRDPRLLMAVKTAPGVELLHATICAIAPLYRRWHARVLTPLLRDAVRDVEPWLAEAVRLLPALDKARVELAMPLGARGRAFQTRIVVGAPVPWNGLDGRTAAVLAMHECSVQDSGASGYVAVEWAALRTLSRVMQRASEPLREAHARWLGALGLGPLLDALVRQGQLGAALRDRLMQEPEHRGDQLAALAED